MISATGLLTATAAVLAWTMTGSGGAGAAGADGPIAVRDANGLARAIAAARGGEHIRLAPGEYGRLEVNGRKFAKPLTLSGPEGRERAHFDALRVEGSSGLRIERIEIGTAQPAADGAYARIAGSQNIVLADSYVHGSLDGNPSNDGLGVHLTGVQDVTVSGNDLEQLQIGVIIKDTSRVRVLGNYIHGIRTDGVMSAAADQIEISSNYITNFTPDPGDHADGIQLHNVGVSRGTSSVTITNNVIMQGVGQGLQGIWISDGNPHRHRDLTISNNLIYISAMYNGIGLNDVEGARVIGNTVVSPAGDEMTAWIRLGNAMNVQLENNISDRLIVRGTVSGVTRKDNMFFVGRATPACLFPKLDAGAAANAADFIVPGVGFQAGPGIHPMLKLAAAPAGRAGAARRCAGQTEN